MGENKRAETWLPVVGYEGLYEVSSLGMVRSLDRVESCPDGKIGGRRLKGTMKKLWRNRLGYFLVKICKNGKVTSICVHRLVAQSFIPNLESKPHVNHIDFNPSNNKASNLEWVTPLENRAHTVRHGRAVGPKGERAFNAKLTDKQALHIFNSQVSIESLAKKYNITTEAVRRIKRGAGWNHVTGKVRDIRLKKLSDNDVLGIFNSAEKYSNIANKYGVSANYVSLIKIGRVGYSITGIKRKKQKRHEKK